MIMFFPESIRKRMFESCINIRGRKGIFLRYILFSSLVSRCGRNVMIGEGVYFRNLQLLRCGDNVSINEMCFIDASGGLEIGSNVSIAHGCSILTSNHTYMDPNQPIKYNPITFAPVVIDEDVWIGCGCRILAGVTLHKRCIVAAGAVVNKDVNSGTIVGGVPAHTIKQIDQQ